MGTEIKEGVWYPGKHWGDIPSSSAGTVYHIQIESKNGEQDKHILVPSTSFRVRAQDSTYYDISIHGDVHKMPMFPAFSLDCVESFRICSFNALNHEGQRTKWCLYVPTCSLFKCLEIVATFPETQGMTKLLMEEYPEKGFPEILGKRVVVFWVGCNPGDDLHFAHADMQKNTYLVFQSMASAEAARSVFEGKDLPLSATRDEFARRRNEITNEVAGHALQTFGNL